MVGDTTEKGAIVKVYALVKGPQSVLPDESYDMKKVKWLIKIIKNKILWKLNFLIKLFNSWF